MPVVTEDQQQPKKRGRGALWLLVLPLLLLMLLLVPAVHPVVVPVGDYALFASLERAFVPDFPPQGFHSYDDPLPSSVGWLDMSVKTPWPSWQVTGHVKGGTLRTGPWVYWVLWSRARRVH